MTMTSNDTAGGEALRVLFDRLAAGLRTAVPARVVAVAADGTTVDVQPTVSMTHRLDGEALQLDLPVIRGVPVQLLGSTVLGLFVAVPITVGDDGLLVVTDRALDNWQHGAGVSQPPEMHTPRHHDLTDAVYIPGLQRLSGAVPDYPTDAVQVRNRAGDCMAEVGLTRVHAITPAGDELTMQGGTIELEVPGGARLTMAGDTVTIAGKLVVTTSIASPSIKVDGKELDDHVHSGVTAGGSNTGPNV